MRNLKNIEELLTKMKNLVPHRDERKGLTDALCTLEKNRILDFKTARQIEESSFSFSEFQSLALYHKHGFFPNMAEYREDMMLMPQVLSPLFGIMMAEISFASFACRYSRDVPTILSLGAGGGFLDRDFIDHINSTQFLEMGIQTPHSCMLFADQSQFIITDAGDYAIGQLKKELAPVLNDHNLKGRISIQKIDASNFKLGPRKFGIVYSNELIDNLPAEPIVSYKGENYLVRIVASDKTATGGFCISGIEGIIKKEAALAQIDSNKSKGLKFTPVFIPLNFNPEIEDCFAGFEDRINHENHGGIYPVYLGLSGMFRSIKNSFEQGSVIIIDTTSEDEGYHNWNIAVNNFQSYKFGEEDMDFYIDPTQIRRVAQKFGMSVEMDCTLDEPLKQMVRILASKGPTAPKRWAEAQGHPYSDRALQAFMMNYSLMIREARLWSFQAFRF